jgi:quercetin dioxygenase-like cupin family protein
MSLFYVLEGQHVFTVGGMEFEAGPGDLVFGPRGVPHAHSKTCSDYDEHPAIAISVSIIHDQIVKAM